MGEIEVTQLSIGDKSRRCAIGAINELRASSHLMAAGYYVYRCLAPHAPFDLVAYRDGRCLRVEVKSISYPNGFFQRDLDDVIYKQAPTFGWPTNDQWDVLVIVGEDRCFCFDSDTPREDVKATIRKHYGCDYASSHYGIDAVEPLP